VRADEADAVPQAIEALQRGDFPSAERLLRMRLQKQPNDIEALSVLGPVLDQEKKYAEADKVYRRVLAKAPPEPALLNNYGNHLLAIGATIEARKTFLKVIGLDAENGNAVVQLARLAFERKAPSEATGYLDRLPASARDRPDIMILQMQADYALQRDAQGDAMLARLSPNAQKDSSQSFALGLALSSVGKYDKAEPLFSKTLEAEPANFQALYYLGLAASHAGHNERAQSVLRQALERQPENVDVMYDLAAVDIALDQKDVALELLAQASRLAPKRADVLRLLALTSTGLGYFADAGRVWDDYLKLVPGEDTARREKAFAETAVGEDMQTGLTELRTFVRRHPNDAAGHYELGTAQTGKQPDQALQELNKALSLKPDLAGAHVAHGLLLYRQGKPKQALSDFEFAVTREPKNATILDRLGETYLALDRPSDALPVLRKAADLSPSNSTVLLHLGRALSKLGKTQEAQAVFARCRELGPNRSESPHPAGLVEFLGLSPEEQMTKYRAGVERTVKDNPGDAEAHVRYLSILLDENKPSEALIAIQKLTTLQLSPSLLQQAAGTLLRAKQYAALKQLLEQRGSLAYSPDLELEMAIADSHVKGEEAGLRDLEHIPASERHGDYYLARAQILEELGRWQEAESAVKQAIQANPAHPELYLEASLLLMQDHRLPGALELLNEASHAAPNNPQVLLLKAMTLELTGDRTSSDSELKHIETLWPEWYKVWLAHALVLESRQEYEQARPMREAASALGAPASLVDVGENPQRAKGTLADRIQVLFH
jgi:tetratricopeptide (TPR) repeat protein